MKQNNIHYFVDGHTAKGYVNFYSSNFDALHTVLSLADYPQLLVTGILSMAAAQALERGHTVHWVHHCLNRGVCGIVVPRSGVGLFHAAGGDLPYSANRLWEDTEDSWLDCAHTQMAKALQIHDEWEKIYIAQLDVEAMNQLTAETIARVLKDRAMEKTGTVRHRFLGAATVDGSFDFIDSITQTIGKRYLIKGRPGTGKSTFLKKIAAEARQRGFDLEVYHCGFDADSVDMIVLRELGVCLFDSTAPHEYAPTRPTDEVIDVYAAAVAPGTDETFHAELAEIGLAYRQTMQTATHFLQRAQRSIDERQKKSLAAMDWQRIERMQQAIQKEWSDLLQPEV